MTYSTESASRSQSDWNGRGYRSCGGFARWRPLELLAMILGFIVFWPIGLAVIAFKVWQRRSGYPGDVFAFAEDRARSARDACRGRKSSSGGGWGFRPTGNSAFDDWRAGELSRLEEERRKLEAAEREFAEHIEQLRRARDREEFDRFMRDRANRAP